MVPGSRIYMLNWKILSGLGVGEEDGGPGVMQAPLGGDVIPAKGEQRLQFAHFPSQKP